MATYGLPRVDRVVRTGDVVRHQAGVRALTAGAGQSFGQSLTEKVQAHKHVVLTYALVSVWLAVAMVVVYAAEQALMGSGLVATYLAGVLIFGRRRLSRSLNSSSRCQRQPSRRLSRSFSSRSRCQRQSSR